MPKPRHGKHPMITHSFQFSSAAKLYVKHLASIKEIRDSKSKDAKNLYAKYVKIVKEMRAETYRNIDEFGKILLELLCEKEGLAHKETASVGQFAGGKIHYLWIEKTKDKEKIRRVREVPMVSFALPIPNKVQDNNDASWETYWGAFDIVGADRIKVWVVYDFGFKTPNLETTNLRVSKKQGLWYFSRGGIRIVLDLDTAEIRQPRWVGSRKSQIASWRCIYSSETPVVVSKIMGVSFLLPFARYFSPCANTTALGLGSARFRILSITQYLNLST